MKLDSPNRNIFASYYSVRSAFWTKSFLAFTLCCSLGSAAAASDWREFRGNRGDGQSPVAELPTKWSATENVRWRTELPGSGWSSPVTEGSRIYVTAAIPKGEDSKSDLDLALLIISARDGKLIRTVSLFTEAAGTAPKIHSKNSHASPTPLIRGNRVFVHFGHQGTAATTLDGEILWRNDQLGYPPVHGNGGSPALVGDHLIFSQDGAEKGEILALDANTGQVKWRVARDVEASKKFSFCTPLVLEQKGRSQIILPGSNVVQSLDPVTGKEIWRVRYQGYSVIPRPLYVEGLVMICTGYDSPVLMAIRPDGEGDVTDSHVAWTVKTNVPHTPSLAAVEGLLFLISDKGIASCLDAKSGEQIWRERIGGNFSASPLVAGSKIYLLSEDGVTTVIAASKTYQELSKNTLGERTLASMAPMENDLLIRTAGSLLRIGN